MAQKELKYNGLSESQSEGGWRWERDWRRTFSAPNLLILNILSDRSVFHVSKKLGFGHGDQKRLMSSSA